MAEHLVHLAKTLRTHGEELVITPAECLECGFTFTRREKLKRPSRCPRCGTTRLTLPEFAIRPKG